MVWLESYSEITSKLLAVVRNCDGTLISFPGLGIMTQSEHHLPPLRNTPQSYLSNFHIDHVINQISNQHQDLYGAQDF